jgi:GNAT superfamily N-acetyltransferase
MLSTSRRLRYYSTGRRVMVRNLLPHEWERLRPIFMAEGERLPEWSGLPCMVEEDENGIIVGVLLLHQALPQLEMFVVKEARGNGTARRLADMMREELQAEGIERYLAFARNEIVMRLCSELGMAAQSGTMYMMEGR